MLNILKFVKNAGHLEQQVVLQPEDRLEGLINAPVECQLQMHGERDAANRPIVIGHVTAKLTTDCQVCMKTISVDYEFDFNLYPVTQEQADDLNDDQDPLIINDGVIEIADLVTNELILSLPPVLTHEVLAEEDCSKHQVMRAGEPVEQKKRSPFEVLKQLKSDDFNS